MLRRQNNLMKSPIAAQCIGWVGATSYLIILAFFICCGGKFNKWCNAAKST